MRCPESMEALKEEKLRFNFAYYRDSITLNLMQKRLDIERKMINEGTANFHKNNTNRGDQKTTIIRKAKHFNENCPHKMRKHYARGMCNICYCDWFKNKSKMVCGHPEKTYYSRGLCYSCWNKQKKKGLIQE